MSSESPRCSWLSLTLRLGPTPCTDGSILGERPVWHKTRHAEDMQKTCRKECRIRQSNEEVWPNDSLEVQGSPVK